MFLPAVILDHHSLHSLFFLQIIAHEKIPLGLLSASCCNNRLSSIPFFVNSCTRPINHSINQVFASCNTKWPFSFLQMFCRTTVMFFCCKLLVMLLIFLFSCKAGVKILSICDYMWIICCWGHKLVSRKDDASYFQCRHHASFSSWQFK